MAKHIENEREFLQEIMENAILHRSLTNEVLKRVDNFHDYLDFMKVATLTFFNFSHYLEAVLHYKQKADADAAKALMVLHYQTYRGKGMLTAALLLILPSRCSE